MPARSKRGPRDLHARRDGTRSDGAAVRGAARPIGDVRQHCVSPEFSTGGRSHGSVVRVEHTATGLFAYGAYGHENTDLTTGDSNIWYGKGGLRERWTHLGHTVLYGEYEQVRGTDNFAIFDLAALLPAVGSESTSRLWGLGVVQEIDAAAMSLWISYRRVSFDNNDTSAAGIFGYDDFQYVKGGALINF